MTTDRGSTSLPKCSGWCRAGARRYRVTLNTRPTGNVTVTPASDNPDVTFEPATLTFMPAAWNSAQSVTVSALGAGFRWPIGHDQPHRQRLRGRHHGPRRDRDGHARRRRRAAAAVPAAASGPRPPRPASWTASASRGRHAPQRRAVTYSLSGVDASLFTVDAETGQIRLGQAGRWSWGRPTPSP